MTFVYFTTLRKQTNNKTFKICHQLPSTTQCNIQPTGTGFIRHLQLPVMGTKPVRDVSLLSVFTKACVLWVISRFCGQQKITNKETLKYLIPGTGQVDLYET